MKRFPPDVLGLVALVIVAACSVTASIAPPSDTPGAGDPLPTLALWPLPSNWACAGIGMGPLTLEGSIADGVYVPLGSRHIPVFWPPGYRASYVPTLVIRDPQGNLVAIAGTRLDSERLPGLLVCTEGDQIEMFPLATPVAG